MAKSVLIVLKLYLIVVEENLVREN